MFAQQSLAQGLLTEISATPLYPIGAVRFSTDGTKSYRYVRAGAVNIAAGAVVIGTSDATPFSAVVISALATGPNQMVIGVATNAITALYYGFVQKTGATPATTALESATVAAGDPLEPSSTTDGRFDIAAATSLGNSIAWCLTDGGSDAGVVMLDCP